VKDVVEKYAGEKKCKRAGRKREICNGESFSRKGFKREKD
jgi:hypothetical protein